MWPTRSPQMLRGIHPLHTKWKPPVFQVEEDYVSAVVSSCLVRVYVDPPCVFLGVGVPADEEDGAVWFAAVEADDFGDLVVEVDVGGEVLDGDVLVGFDVVDVGVGLDSGADGGA